MKVIWHDKMREDVAITQKSFGLLSLSLSIKK